MIAGYHLVWTVYGYWLANDPHGSMAREIRDLLIAELGAIYYGRKRIQPVARVLGKSGGMALSADRRGVRLSLCLGTCRLVFPTTRIQGECANSR